MQGDGEATLHRARDLAARHGPDHRAQGHASQVAARARRRRITSRWGCTPISTRRRSSRCSEMIDFLVDREEDEPRRGLHPLLGRGRSPRHAAGRRHQGRARHARQVDVRASRRPVRDDERAPRRRLLAVTALVVAAIGLFTLARAPTPFGNFQLYASIARARELYGIGVRPKPGIRPRPSITSRSTVRYSSISASSRCGVFGSTLLGFPHRQRLGMAVLVGAGALLARELSGARDRWLWAPR